MSEASNRKLVKGWMRLHGGEYSNSTTASENCADELDLYENHVDYPIPEYVFEIALDYVSNE